MRLIEEINNHIYAEDEYETDAIGILQVENVEMPNRDGTTSLIPMDTILQQDIASTFDIFDSFRPQTWTMGRAYVLESGFVIALYENRHYVPYVPEEKGWELN